MPRIKTEIVDQIKARAEVMDVVSDVLQLKKVGRNFFGLCPFHEEKTPSFSVNPQMGIFHCFGCGKSGNAISFVMEYENVDYVEALKRLADRYGIKIEWEQGRSAQQGQTALLYELHEEAGRFYHQQLFSPAGKSALEYLYNRNFSQEILKKFNIGYAPDQWDSLFSRIDKQKYSALIIEKSGLFIAKKQLSGFYDRFRNRIMFPIKSISGRTIAFGGRSLDPHEPAKYMNSPETPIYFKRGILYGLDVTNPAIRRAEQAIVVEGYTDLLRLYAVGFENIVAGSGTALTEHHARLLNRFIKEAVLCYDGDTAGAQATVRAGFLMLKEGLDVRVIVLPQDEDPDSFLVKQGKAAFEKQMQAAPDFITFYINRHRDELNTPASKTEFINLLVQEISEVKNPVTRDFLVKVLSEQLEINPERIFGQMRYFLRRRKNKRRDLSTGAAKPMQKELRNASDRAEYELLKVLMSGQVLLQNIILAELDKTHFCHPVLLKIAALIFEKLADNGEELNGRDLLSEIEDTEERFYLTRIIIEAEPWQDADELSELISLTADCIVVLLSQKIDAEIVALRQNIKKQEQDGKDIGALVIELSRKQKERKTLSQRIKSKLSQQE